MYQPYIETVNYIQGLDIKDKKQIYEIYKELLPKKSIFAKYIKNQTENTSTSLAEHISLYYQVSLREATNYINILPTEVIKEILEELGVEEKEIKKLTKVGKEKQNTK
jgi:L-cysteine desulfidase